MTNEEHYPEEYMEKLKLLKNYISDFEDTTTELEREIRAVKEAAFPNDEVSNELGEIIKRVCGRMIDSWISKLFK